MKNKILNIQTFFKGRKEILSECIQKSVKILSEISTCYQETLKEKKDAFEKEKKSINDKVKKNSEQTKKIPTSDCIDQDLLNINENSNLQDKEVIQNTIYNFINKYIISIRLSYNNRKENEFITIEDQFEAQMEKSSEKIEESIENLEDKNKTLNEKLGDCKKSLVEFASQFPQEKSNKIHDFDKLSISKKLSTIEYLLTANKDFVNESLKDVNSVKNDTNTIISYVKDIKKKSYILNAPELELIHKYLEEIDTKISRIEKIHVKIKGFKKNTLFTKKKNKHIISIVLEKIENQLKSIGDSLKPTKDNTIKLLEKKILNDLNFQQQLLNDVQKETSGIINQSHTITPNLKFIDDKHKSFVCLIKKLRFVIGGLEKCKTFLEDNQDKCDIPLYKKDKNIFKKDKKKKVLFEEFITNYQEEEKNLCDKYPDLFQRNYNSLIKKKTKEFNLLCKNQNTINQYIQIISQALNRNLILFEEIKKFKDELEKNIEKKDGIEPDKTILNNIHQNQKRLNLNLNEIISNDISIIDKEMKKDIKSAEDIINSLSKSNINTYLNDLISYYEVKIKIDSKLDETKKNVAQIKEKTTLLYETYSKLISTFKKLLDCDRIEFNNFLFDSINSKVDDLEAQKDSINSNEIINTIKDILIAESHKKIKTTFTKRINTDCSETKQIYKTLFNIEATLIMDDVNQFLVKEKIKIDRHKFVVNTDTIINECKADIETDIKTLYHKLL